MLQKLQVNGRPSELCLLLKPSSGIHRAPHILVEMVMLLHPRMIIGDDASKSALLDGLVTVNASFVEGEPPAPNASRSHLTLSTGVQAAIAIVVIFLAVVVAGICAGLHYNRCMRNRCSICRYMCCHVRMRRWVRRKDAGISGELIHNHSLESGFHPCVHQ